MFRVTLAIAVVLLAGCGPLPLGEPRPVTPVDYVPVTAKGYPADGLLVDAGWVAARLADPTVRLVDLSPWHRYRQGHLPGAVHLWWQDTMELNNEVYGMLIGPPARAELLGKLGIDQATTVIAYDDEGGVWAARLVWLLEFTGHQRVHLLDGGAQAWLASGRALTTEIPRPAPVTYVETVRPERIIAAEDLTGLTNRGGAIVDGRAATEITETWKGRLRVGQVPAALLRPWPENLVAPAGPFRPAGELRQRYAAALSGGGPVAVYGLFGAVAAHDYVALRALGAADVRLYDGSWAQWGATEELPIASIE